LHGLHLKYKYFIIYSNLCILYPDVIKVSVNQNSETTVAQPPDENKTSENNDNLTSSARRSLTWRAEKKSTVVVKEINRPVEAYMALPASQYSVLTSDSISRIDDTNFKANMPSMNFFGTVIRPVLYVDVTVYPEDAKSIIAVKRAETVGSPVAESINGTFNIKAINAVSAGIDGKNRKTLTSDTKLVIDVLIPESSKIPTGVLQKTGNFILQSSLNVIVPTFVRLLAFDFRRWSAGDDSRNAIDGATLG
jgi:hypothetical protein